MSTNQLNIQVSKRNHIDTTDRAPGQSDVDFIQAAVNNTNVNGLDLVTVDISDQSVGSSPVPNNFVVVQRQSGQRDQGFLGDISSAIKTAAGL